MLVGLPLALQTVAPQLTGFVWGWASFLLGMPWLVAGLLLLWQPVGKAGSLWLLALALPVFIVAANLHDEVSREAGGEEPVFLFVAQVAPPALLLTGLSGLLGLVGRTGWTRLHRWRQRRQFRALRR